MQTARQGLMAILVILWFFCFASFNLVQAYSMDVHTSGTLSFGSMLGMPGTYYSNEVQVFISAPHPIVVIFEADQFTYCDSKWSMDKVSLDVTYWVNNPQCNQLMGFGRDKFNFASSVLEIHSIPSCDGLHVFTLFGEVHMGDIEDQPAGEYRGTIWVTVRNPI